MTKSIIPLCTLDLIKLGRGSCSANVIRSTVEIGPEFGVFRHTSPFCGSSRRGYPVWYQSIGSSRRHSTTGAKIASESIR